MSSITVVIPTYDRAGWLPATVASVLQQTRPPDEALIVDDGSRDDTEAVCRAFPAPVRYVRQENAGVSAARNRGVREARGEWVAFLDSDDLWEPTKLEVQLAAHEAAPEAGWSITECVLVDGDDRPVPGARGLESAVPVFRDVGRTCREWLAGALRELQVEAGGARHDVFVGDAYGLLFEGNVVLPSAAMVRRDVFLRSGGFDEALRVAEDTELFHRLGAASPMAAVMSPLLRWRVGHEERLTANANTRDLVRNALLSNERAARLRSPLSPEEERARRAGRQRLLLRLGYLHLSLMEQREARTAVRDAWRQGAAISRRSVGIYGGSLLPTSMLRGLHLLKRVLNG
ncbi:MAG TPA: glycosyltransferase family 2 protein [Longimicrobiaceae bacterium]|nr:glycosyltransferase family 2 protein [Longimicrobiaceae bacterium]